jgi:hypothetical protein
MHFGNHCSRGENDSAVSANLKLKERKPMKADAKTEKAVMAF